MFDAFCESPYLAGYDDKTGVFSTIHASKEEWVKLAQYILEVFPNNS